MARVTSLRRTRPCVDKSRYDREKAHHIARYRSRLEDDPVRAYVCRRCGEWHVGHVRRHSR